MNFKGEQCYNNIIILESTARYAGLLLAPAEGFGLRLRPFWPSANPFWPLAKVMNYEWVI